MPWAVAVHAYQQLARMRGRFARHKPLRAAVGMVWIEPAAGAPVSHVHSVQALGAPLSAVAAATAAAAAVLPVV